MAAQNSIIDTLKKPRYHGIMTAYAVSQEISLSGVRRRLRGKRTALYRETVRGLREMMKERDKEFKANGKVQKIVRREQAKKSAGRAS